MAEEFSQYKPRRTARPKQRTHFPKLPKKLAIQTVIALILFFSVYAVNSFDPHSASPLGNTIKRILFYEVDTEPISRTIGNIISHIQKPEEETIQNETAEQITPDQNP